MSSSSKLLRCLSIVAGLAVVGVCANVTLAHVTEPDQRQLVVAMAGGAAFAAFMLPLLWERHKALALLALIGVILGEGYGLAQTIERILGVREERSRVIATENQALAMQKARVTRLTTELDTANKAVLEEAGKGGCKNACRDKKIEADAARVRLEEAEKALAAMPAPKSEARLADKLGVPADLVDVALAAAASLALMCFQLAFLALGHGREEKRVAETPRVLDTEEKPAPRTKHEEAAEFARAYQAKHGRPPAWAEVHKAGFSPATASRALRLVR